MKINLLYSLVLILAIFSVSCNKETEEPEIETSYTKSIERIFSNDFEKNLIEIAENTYPPRMHVWAAAALSNFEIPDTAYWYYNSFDGVLIPYAITNEAINYYSDLIDDLDAGRINTFFITADFEYKAEVEFRENFSISVNENENPEDYKDVQIVQMNIK